MADEQMTPQEFVRKVDWEGGVIDALDYGLRAKDMDDSNPAFKAGWQELERLWLDFEPMLRAMETMIEENWGSEE